MLRGEIRLVDLDSAQGSEADKRRPAIIVSNDAVNNQAAQLGRGVVTIVPLTSNVERVYRFQVLLPAGTGGLTRDSKAQAEQVRSLDAGRVGRRLGALPVDTMASLDRALRLHLAL